MLYLAISTNLPYELALLIISLLTIIPFLAIISPFGAIISLFNNLPVRNSTSVSILEFDVKWIGLDVVVI